MKANWSILDQFFNSIGQFLIVLIVSKTTSLELFGEFTLTMFLVLLMTQLMNAAVIQPHSIMSSEIRHNADNVECHLHTIFIFFSIVLCSVVFLYSYFVLSKFSPYLTLYSVVRFLFEYTRKIQYTHRRPETAARISLSYWIPQVASISLLVLYQPKSVDDVFQVIVISNFLFIFTSLNMQPLKSILTGRLTTKGGNELNGIISASVLSTLIPLMTTRSMPFIVEQSMTAHLAGVFITMMLVVNLMNPLFLTIQNHLIPSLTFEHIRNEVNKEQKQLMKLSYAASTLIFFMFYFFSEDIVRFLYTKEIAAYADCTLYLSLISFVALHMNIIQARLRAIREFRIISISFAFGLLVLVIFSLIPIEQASLVYMSKLLLSVHIVVFLSLKYFERRVQ